MPAKPTRILVVDDDTDTCANFADILTDFGYDVRTAQDGRAALQMLETQSFDIALFDLRMPEMDGLQFYRELRRRSPSTVAILITGFVDPSMREEAERLGVWRVMSKPVDLAALMPLIEDTAQQPLVLLVDDDRDFCDSLYDILRQHGFRVGIAGSADQATRQFRGHEFQVVIVDWCLPDANGLQLLQRIRDERPVARTVLLTGHRLELNELLDTASQAKADVLFYKPLEMDRFLDELRRLAGQARQ